MRLRRVRLLAAAPLLEETIALYASLGLPVEGATVGVGETELELAPADGAPFYHFALLCPGDRFDAALAWARGRVEVLGEPDPVFDFRSWDALACYFHDPAGNIVELIAHRGLGETGETGAFHGAELLGFSELGLVGEVPALRGALARVGLPLWSGADAPGQLAFVGAKGRTLILAPSGRGWLPTDRPAEPHPVEAAVEGATGEARVGGHVVRPA